jgi:hypothetical protein
MATQGGLFPARESTGSWWRDHSLSIVLIAILTIQTAHALWAGHAVWITETQTHGDPVMGGWPKDFWIWWSWEYNISLVADTFGVLLIVVLTKWLNEQGSSEGRDD